MKTVKRSFVSLLIGLLLSLTIVSAFAFYAVGSTYTFPITINGYNYQNYSTIYTDTTSAWGYTAMQSLSGNTPAGYMRIISKLYNGSGTVLMQNMSINNGPASGFSVSSGYYNGSGEYYARGKTEGWSGTTYAGYYSLPSQHLNVN